MVKRNNIKKYGLLGCLLGAMVLLSSCRFLQSQGEAQASAESALVSADVIVKRIGEKRVLNLPSEDVFAGRSANLRSSAYPLLDSVVDYIQDDTILSLGVMVYADSQMHHSQRSRALARDQAARVMAYLQQKGVSAARFWFAAPRVAEKSMQHYRIQIRYEVLPALPPLSYSNNIMTKTE